MDKEALNFPDIGRRLQVGSISTNYHDQGEGRAIVLLHGSGPGVTAWQNWSRVIPLLSENYRVVAPDIVGFGFSPLPDGGEPHIKLWLEHLVGFLDALGLDKATLVGNSFGGALALAMMAKHAHRVDALVVMGTPAGQFEQTGGLGSTHGFEPTLENMEVLMKSFPFDPSMITPEMVRARHAVALVSSGQATIRKLQPRPSEGGAPKIVKGVPLEQLDAIKVPTLILHGREDRMIPLDVAVRAHRHIENSDLHVFGKCGHWVQMEREPQFVKLVEDFMEGHA